jgi:hypothetical protein
MKNRIIVILGVALVASGIAVRADDTPDQAAARTALEQKMAELDHAQSPPPADANSVVAVAKLAESNIPESNISANEAVSTTAAALRMALADTVPVVAPAAEVPVTVAPAEAAPVSTTPADADFPQKIPDADASAQASALAALQQKMTELDQRAAQPPTNTNSLAAVAKPVRATANTAGMVATNTVTTQTTPAAAPAAEASAAANASARAAALAAMQRKMNELNQPEAQPVTETPAAQAPVAISPGIVPSTAAPVSSAPAVVAPAPEVSAAPAAAAAAVDVAPAATAEPVAVPTGTQPAAAPVTSEPALAVPAPMILPSSSSGQARPENQLVTMSGATYKNVEVESVRDDGIIISYTAADGGWGSTKVHFEDLPAEIRQQYGK